MRIIGSILLAMIATVMLSVALMAIAAVQAQVAYQCRQDDPSIAMRFTRSAIRLGLTGLACFVAAKVLA